MKNSIYDAARLAGKENENLGNLKKKRSEKQAYCGSS